MARTMGELRIPDTGAAELRAAGRTDVLIAHPDPTVRHPLEEILTAAGTRFASCGDGRAALAAMRAAAPGLLLLDLQIAAGDALDRLDAFEVLEAMRSDPLLSGVPIIGLVTAGCPPELGIFGLEAGMIDVIGIPLDVPSGAELLARIRRHMRPDADPRATTPAPRATQPGAAQLADQLAADLGAGQDVHIDVLGGAQRLCDLLRGATSASAVALFDVRDGVVGEVLGRCGSPLPVPGLSGTSLQRRAELGAWIVADGRRATAYVPLQAGSGLRALLAARVETDRPGAAAAAAADELTSWVDATNSVAGPLGILLAERQDQERQVREIEQTIHHRHFHPIFQPVVVLAEGVPAGYEALTRFGDGRPPMVWFAQAKAVGRLVELEHATARAALLRSGTGEEWLSINLCARALCHPDLPGMLEGISRPIVVELTDHHSAPDHALLRRAVDALPNHARLAVDDGGGGHLSLQRVMPLAPAFVKLQRSLVSRLESDPVRRSIICGLVGFAADNGIQVIAEGVETALERDTLLELGVLLGQGWLFGHPG